MSDNNLLKFGEWREKADEDFKSAKILLNNDGVPATICFLSQQTVEKLLKGFLVFHEVGFPKIHQLDELLERCAKIDADFREFIEEVVILNDYYIESRYPDNMKEDITFEEAKEAFEIAERMRNFILLKTEK